MTDLSIKEWDLLSDNEDRRRRHNINDMSEEDYDLWLADMNRRDDEENEAWEKYLREEAEFNRRLGENYKSVNKIINTLLELINPNKEAK